MKTKYFWAIAMSALLVFSCTGKKETEKEDEDSSILIEKKTGISLIAFESGFEHSWLFGIKPRVKTEWKNISDKEIEKVIRIDFVFIDNKTGKELSNQRRDLSRPFLSNTIKEESVTSNQVTLETEAGKQASGLTSNKEHVIEAIKELDISCHIYVGGKFYKEIKIENKLNSFYF